MLGGQNSNLGRIPEWKNNYSKPSSAIPETAKEKKAEEALKNIDDVIEFVVKDISGTATGNYMASKTSDHQYKIIKNILSRHRAFSKPAPASKKKLMQLKYQRSSKRLFDTDPTVHHSALLHSDKLDDSIHDTISSVIYQTVDCSVSTLDLFHFSPLSNVMCTGCLRKFNDRQAHPVDGELQESIRE